MANIAENKFMLSFDKNCTEEDRELIYNRIIEVFKHVLEGAITYESEDGSCLEGWFESRWSFPKDTWEEILEDKPVYFRCLTEEYGMGLVSMNIHDEDDYWREPQYFDL